MQDFTITIDRRDDDTPWRAVARLAGRVAGIAVVSDDDCSMQGFCPACREHYEDDGTCDEGKPLMSPHRGSSGVPLHARAVEAARQALANAVAEREWLH